MAGLTGEPCFVHLHVHTDHSFGDGTSQADDLVREAVRLGQTALAVTDTQHLSAIPGLVRSCRGAGLHPIGGCEVHLEDDTRLTLLMDGPRGWRALCQILSAAGLRDTQRIGLRVRWQDIEENAAGLICLTGSPEHGAVPLLCRRRDHDGALQHAQRLLSLFGAGNVYMEVVRSLVEGERAVSRTLFELADYLRIPVLATNAVRHARRSDYALHETLRRVGLGILSDPNRDEEHGEMPINAERYLKHAETMRRLFPDRPDALRNSIELATRLAAPLEAGAWHLPKYPGTPEGESAWNYLAAITWRGAGRRYDKPLPRKVFLRLTHELEIIREKGFSDYFLVCADICAEARRRQIRYALRGSGVGSAVAYCLGIGQHDPIAHDITFDRFLSMHRRKPPDIDIDFEHRERDPMMDWTRQRYGPERVANLVNYVRWRGRTMLRDLGKSLGHNTQEIDRLRRLLVFCKGNSLAEEIEARPELRALGISAARYETLFALCARLAGAVRHYGTHSSGIVVSNIPLADIAPLQWAAKGVPVVCLDKDDVEADGIGLLKIDQLSLRALSTLSATERAVQRTHAPHFDLRRRDLNDPETFAMIRRGETIGVFQFESPAQMALQQRFGSETLGDLTQTVALIRPGPALGGSVDEYVARRHGFAPHWDYPLPGLAAILDETYGRIVFQDQVLDVIRVVGDLPHDEADRWLKTMTHARSEASMDELGQELQARALRLHPNLPPESFAGLWRQIKGFARYGFCHGHAFAFAHHAHSTAYLLCHYPAEYLAAMLSQQPCGFWPVSTLVAEAGRRGVPTLSPCLLRSDPLFWSVESDANSQKSLRPSLVQIRGIGEAEALWIADIRTRWTTTRTLTLETIAQALSPQIDRETREWLALSGALDKIEPNRRRALWAMSSFRSGAATRRRYPDTTSSDPAILSDLLDGDESDLRDPGALRHPGALRDLPDFHATERFQREWSAIRFSTQGNPMQFHREGLAARNVAPCSALAGCASGERIIVAGLVLRPHRPPTPSGKTVIFFALEDETALIQVTVMPDAYAHCGPVVCGQHAALICGGRAQWRGNGVSLMLERAKPLLDVPIGG